MRYAFAMREHVTAELEATLLRELRSTWSDVNRVYFKSALKAPLFRLSESASVLGRWYAETRILELSRQLVHDAKWGQVVEVLKHEIAHQYVHEVLKVLDETAHGPAFRQICERMGTDPAASGMPADATVSDNPERERLLRRVTGLLALADSPNQHEAESATALAQRLMLKYNIARIDADGAASGYGFRHIGEPKGRVYEPEHLLAGILADHFFVDAIWVPAFRPHDGRRGSVLEICGSHENLEMACYVHAFLSGTADRLWKEHKIDEGITSNRERRTYRAGVMEGFHSRLKSEQRRSASAGLVWVGDPELDRYYKKRHPRIRTVRLQGHGHSRTRASGREAGQQIVLHKGVKQGGRSRGRLLPPKP